MELDFFISLYKLLNFIAIILNFSGDEWLKINF